MKIGPPLFWLGVSLWVGGLVALAIAAPIIFRNAPSRESAGAIFGGVLRGFSRVEIVCALLAVAGSVLSWTRPASTIDLVRAGLLGLMILILAALQIWVVPAVETARSTDPQSFKSLHGVSEALYKVNVFAGLALIVLSALRRPPGSS